MAPVDDHHARSRRIQRIRHELDAEAAKSAVWLALHAIERAGYTDLIAPLSDIVWQTQQRYRALLDAKGNDV